MVFLIYSQRHTASTWYPLDVPCWQLSTPCSRKSSGFWTGCSKCLWQPFLGFSRATPLLAGERRRLPPQASIFSYKQNPVGLYFSLLHRSGRARPSSSKWRVGRFRYMGAQGMASDMALMARLWVYVADTTAADRQWWSVLWGGEHQSPVLAQQRWIPLCVLLCSHFCGTVTPWAKVALSLVLLAGVLEPFFVCGNRKSDGHKELRQDPLLYNLWIQITYYGDQVLEAWARFCLLYLVRYPPKGPPGLWPQPLMWS